MARGDIPEDMASGMGYQAELDELAVADRLRLLGFIRRDDQMLYLRDFEGLARANQDADGEEIIQRLSSLDRVVDDMAQRTARFHLTLGDITRTTDTSPEVFLRYKDALLSHLHNFVVELERYLPRMAQAVVAVEQTGLETLLDRAALADERPLMGHAGIA